MVKATYAIIAPMGPMTRIIIKKMAAPLSAILELKCRAFRQSVFGVWWKSEVFGGS